MTLYELVLETKDLDPEDDAYLNVMRLVSGEGDDVPASLIDWACDTWAPPFGLEAEPTLTVKQFHPLHFDRDTDPEYPGFEVVSTVWETRLS